MDRDPNIQGRRAASRATKLRRRKVRMNILILLGMAAIVLILVMVLGNNPLMKAMWRKLIPGRNKEQSGEEMRA